MNTTEYVVSNGESCLKPLSDLERAINNTSVGDMLLFMIALDRRDKERSRPDPIIIGFND